MKKLLTTLILICAITAAKAQNSYIKIDYDANGNRVLRQYVGGKPAPPEDTTAVALTDASTVPNDTIANRGLTDLAKSGFKVYPNPSDNNFNIALDAAMLQNHCEMVLTDQLGKTHLRKALTESVTIISTRQLADGVYYIIITNGKSKSTVRIVKQSK